MEISSTPMEDEIQAVQRQTTRLPVFGWRLEINVGDEIIVPTRLISLDIDRSYDVNFADRVVAKIYILGGTYALKILPKRWNLTGTLYQEPLSSDTNEPITALDTYTQEVNISLIDNGDASLISQNNILNNEEDANRTLGFLQVEVQLSDLVLEQARMVTLGGVYRNTSVQDLVKYLMTKTLQDIRSDESMAVTHVKMFPASNSAPIPNIVLPHGLPFTEVPDYIHERVGGIYNAGLGHYLQDSTWHIFPLFDLTRYENDLRGLTVINVPSNRFTKLERSFRTTANQVIVLVSGDGAVYDDSEQRQLSDGNGVRFSSADKMLNGFVQQDGNKATAIRAENNSEFVTSERESGRNKVKLSDNPITDNVFLEASKLARGQGTYVAKVWENSNPRLLWPGMPVRWMYMDGEEWIERHGVLHGAQSFVQATAPFPTTRRHISTTTLRVFLERPKPAGTEE